MSQINSRHFHFPVNDTHETNEAVQMENHFASYRMVIDLGPLPFAFQEVSQTLVSVNLNGLCVIPPPTPCQDPKQGTDLT